MPSAHQLSTKVTSLMAIPISHRTMKQAAEMAALIARNSSKPMSVPRLNPSSSMEEGQGWEGGRCV